MAGEYELVLMLDPEAAEKQRQKVADEARKLIKSGGSLKHDDHWGMRKLAYEIRHRTEADYHLFRFEADNELLERLNHTLRITDGALRFRIFRVDPGAAQPAPPAAAPAPREQPAPTPAEPAAAPEAEEAQGAEAAAEPAPAGSEASE